MSTFRIGRCTLTDSTQVAAANSLFGHLPPVNPTHACLLASNVLRYFQTKVTAPGTCPSGTPRLMLWPCAIAARKMT